MNQDQVTVRLGADVRVPITLAADALLVLSVDLTPHDYGNGPGRVVPEYGVMVVSAAAYAAGDYNGYTVRSVNECHLGSILVRM